MNCNTCGIETLKLYEDGNCVGCHMRAYQKAYKKTDKYKAYKKTWYQRNKEKLKAMRATGKETKA